MVAQLLQPSCAIHPPHALRANTCWHPIWGIGKRSHHIITDGSLPENKFFFWDVCVYTGADEEIRKKNPNRNGFHLRPTRMLRDTFALHPPAKPFMMILLPIFYWEQMHPFQCITHSNDVTPSSLNRVSISYLWKHGRPIKCIQISILKRKYTSEKCDEIVLRAARSNWTVVEELLRWHQISSAITHPLFFFFLKKEEEETCRGGAARASDSV